MDAAAIKITNMYVRFATKVKELPICTKYYELRHKNKLLRATETAEKATAEKIEGDVKKENDTWKKVLRVYVAPDRLFDPGFSFRKLMSHVDEWCCMKAFKPDRTVTVERKLEEMGDSVRFKREIIWHQNGRVKEVKVCRKGF
jgi:hypothetical protein